jgi:hypothetical protein
VDRFIDRLNARDLPGLAELLLDGPSVENVGESLQFGGREVSLRSERNILRHVVHGHAEWPRDLQPTTSRLQRVEFEGQPVAAAFVSRGGREALSVVYRFEEESGRIARLRSYGLSRPDPRRGRSAGRARLDRPLPRSDASAREGLAAA